MQYIHEIQKASSGDFLELAFMFKVTKKLYNKGRYKISTSLSLKKPIVIFKKLLLFLPISLFIFLPTLTAIDTNLSNALLQKARELDPAASRVEKITWQLWESTIQEDIQALMHIAQYVHYAATAGTAISVATGVYKTNLITPQSKINALVGAVQ